MDDSLQQFALNVPISSDDISNNQASRKRARIACELCHERKTPMFALLGVHLRGLSVLPSSELLSDSGWLSQAPKKETQSPQG
ncbi:hypothetical protein B0O99DRAFT_629238 [Bisporella sp. PMI_857]|nr:hypothetical protein B0O99DRAFT_629238 [Bisporella sp. PMI_857]